MFYSVTVSTLLQEILSFINEKTKLTNNPDITVVNHNIFLHILHSSMALDVQMIKDNFDMID